MRSSLTLGPVRSAGALLAASLLGCASAPAPPQAPPQPAAVRVQAAKTAVIGSEAAAARLLDRVRRNTPLAYMFLREMPKGGDLHNHLSGAVYAESFIGWAAESGFCIDVSESSIETPPCDSAAGRVPAARALTDFALRNRLIDAMSMRNWDPARKSGHDQFFDSFGKTGPTSGRVDDMLAEVAARAAANRVSYLELMLTPEGGSARLGRGFGWSGDMESLRSKLLDAGLRDTLARAAERLERDIAQQRAHLACDTPAPQPGCDVEIRIVYQVLRARAPEMVFAQILAGFEMASQDARVVGLNLVQPEDDRVAMEDYALHMRMIAFLRGKYPGVRVSLHAGELVPGLVPPEGLRFHIRQAVNVAGASRIGHGVDIAYEDSAPELLRTMASRGVLVEIALGSNDAILGVRGSDHPLRTYMRYGVPVALATDDEGVLRSEMTLQYLKAVQEQGVGYLDLKRMARNSIEYSFARPDLKARLLQRLDRDFAAFERRVLAAFENVRTVAPDGAREDDR